MLVITNESEIIGRT